MTQGFWEVVVIATGIVTSIGAVGLTIMGAKAYTTGAAPGAPEAFTSFAGQVLRIASVLVIVGTVLTLAVLQQTINSSVSGILAGIAGYVLGGTEKTPRLSVKHKTLP